MKAGGFRLDDPAGEVGIEFMVALHGEGEQAMPPCDMPMRSAVTDAVTAFAGLSSDVLLTRRW